MNNDEFIDFAKQQGYRVLSQRQDCGIWLTSNTMDERCMPRDFRCRVVCIKDDLGYMVLSKEGTVHTFVFDEVF